MRGFGDHVRKRRVAFMALAGLVLVAGCARDGEATMRARLEQWFSLGETLAFNASIGCVAAVFRLTSTEVKSAMPVVGAVPQVLVTLRQRGTVALDDPDLAPDVALVDLANAHRATGMSMRMAALEARACMDDLTESAFSYALVNPKAVLAYDAEHKALMLLDPGTGVLVVAMGAG